VIEWRAVILRVLEEIGRDIDVGVKESISSLHDINTAVSLVYRNAEGLIDESPGLDLDEKVENADPKLKSLWKSVSLLTTRMNMASIVANPEACRFGKKRPSPIYKVFDKMCHLFEGPASQKHVRIRIMGRSFNSPPAYDSIESLALVLVDNAVKYCLPDMEVIVRVNDLEADFPGVAVEVESVGPLVPIDEQEAIFLKGFRCPNAQQFAAGGSGLGLYIARLIADAHGLKLEYRGVSTTGDQSVGRNTFSFRIR
jgi:K+-sensing histidine kinase KdpD